MWYVCVCSQREAIRLLHLDLFLSQATTLTCRTRKDVRTYGLKSSQRRNKKKRTHSSVVRGKKQRKHKMDNNDRGKLW